MKENNQNKELNTKKKGKSINKKVIAIGTTAILALATIVGVYVASRNSNTLNSLSPEIARSMEYEQVQDGDENLEQTNNVKFDAFFLRDLDGDGYAESIRGTCNEIGEEATLYMELNVLTEGYLKDGKITINSDNFYLQTNLPKDEELAENYVGNNIKEIKLNQINNGTQKLITGIVRSGDYTCSSGKAAAIGNNINNYSKVNSVTLTGIYVTEAGEIPVEKTVEFNVDWHGTTKASIYNASQSTYIDSLIDEENGKLNLSFTVNTEELNKELLLSKNHVEAEIPELNGYAPLEVVYTGSNAEVNYNAETRIITLDRTSSIGEDGTVTNKLSTTNSYSIKVTYPLEAYTSLGVNSVQLKIPVSTYYEGYNNTNEEFTNPYKSNTAKTTIVATYKKYVEVGTNAGIDITVGNYISTPTRRYVVSKQKPMKLYNGQSEEEKDDTYIVKWQGYIGTNTELNTITMQETQNGQEQVVDQFIKTDSTEESMEDVTSNVGIYFSGMDDLLGEEGYIKVYDEETNNLLVTFTKSDWNKYTSGNPYRYETAVKHIRVETSPVVNNDTYFYVYNVKELDDEEIITKYERTQFDELQYIKSQLVMYIGETLVGTDTHQANYEAPYSIASISISNNTLSTQVTEKNDIITINADADLSANQVRWIDGIFLVKLPEGMLTVEINNVEISNANVNVESCELIEEDGQKFIKIVTKNETEQTYDIKIDVDLTPDPRMATATRNIELYASNENGSDYYYSTQDIYDVNNNLNTEELVNYTTTDISMVSPNSLLTNQTASEYDDKGSTVVSPQIADIKPIYAVVDQEQEENTVKIGVQIRNNYASTISEIQMLGKIPFEGNKYVISGGNLGSTFTTKMVNTGIEVPEELKDVATIYYSSNENPDRDLSKAENNWKTVDQVENWDEIKTFLIDLGDYVMPTGKEYVFYYTVKIPNGLEFNQTAYSHHGVYFSLDTDEGKYRTQTEPNKLGFRIAEKYNLELSKYQIGKDKLVPGATYSVQEIITGEDGEETRGEAKTGVTNAQGQLTITNLYAERTYEIREIKTPDDYELNSNVIRFIGHVDDNGILTIEKTGETKEEPEVIKEEGEDYKVKLEVEDEVKASIKITKKEKGTENKLSGVKYKITGYNLPETGKTIRTNTKGEAEINGITINQEYTLEEVKADGYYLASPIKFKVVNNGGNYSIEQITEEGVQSGTISSQNTTEEDSIPTINITLEDEKIPTYNLQLFKIKKTTESTVSEDELIAKAETDLAGTEVTPLANATFKLFKGDEELGKYTTGEDGRATIEGLYQYESEKDIDQTYTLKEVMSPEGYAKVQDISFRVQKDAETNELILIDESGKDRQFTVEGNTVTLVIEDSPSFKLIKKDAETKEVLANVKFAIFNVDDGTEQPARNSKGEIIGTKETINGREYYTVQTDINGELTVDLPEGLYKAVEVEAPEKYDLSNSTYYFGIGASREAPTTYTSTQAMSIGGSGYDYITSVIATSDRGYIVGGYFSSSSITVGDDTLISNSSYSGYEDGMIIKYNAADEVEWATTIGGSSSERITSIAVTSDGGYIVGGNSYSGSITAGDYTITTPLGINGMLIKYGVDGTVEWVRSIGDSIASVAATKDGGYIVGGYFSDSKITVGDYTLTNGGYSDGMIIKYNGEDKVEWARSIGGSSSEEINSVAETSDGGYIVGGHFYSDSITIGDYTLTNGGYSDGMLIKYNAYGEVEWARSIGGSDDDKIQSVSGTSDGDYIVGGYFESSSITVGDYTLTKAGNGDGMIIKYDAYGEVEWATSIGEGGMPEYINSVEGTKDGGFLVVGTFYNSIVVGNFTLNYVGGQTGMVLKYDANNNMEFATTIGGSDDTYINSISETVDGEILVGGYFESSSITVGDYTLINAGKKNGIVIKYGKIEINNPITIKAESIGANYTDEITSVAGTSDGGYIVGGLFYGESITVGDYTITNAGKYDGMVIKYSSDGEVEWASSIGGGYNDEIYSIAETVDGGYIVGGYFTGNITVGDYTLTNNGGPDGMVIKYDEEGEVEWASSIGGYYTDFINSVTETSDGGCIVGGYFCNSITIGDYTLTSNGSSDGMIIKYNSEGKVEWARSIGGISNDEITSVSAISNGGYIVGGYFYSSSITVGDYTLTNAGGTDGIVIKYDGNGEVEWARSIGGSEDEEITSVSEISDGGLIIGGNFESSSITVGDYTLNNNSNKNYSDGMVIKYSSDGEVEWARSIGGIRNDEITSVSAISNGGYIVGGSFYGESITVGDYTITNQGSYDGMMIKYSSDGEVEWAKSVGGSNTDSIESVTELSDGSIIAGAYFSSSTIETDGHTLINGGNYDGIILRIANQVGAPEVQELTVENTRKVFNITTDVNEIDGIKGGSILGEDKNPYEEVKYGDNSVKEIKMTPDEGFEIIGITVNGEEYQFIENSDGTYTMPQFENVTEDKHIVVTYSKKDNKIIINKVDSETQEPLEGVTFKLDQIEERTEPEGVIGSPTDNGVKYTEVDTSNEITNVLGELTNNGSYYFVQNEDGTLVPTNSKTYQIAIGKSSGIQGSTANSYVEIDLSELEGQYTVVVNANVSSESADYGYATITQSSSAPSYSSSTGRFMYISGTSSGVKVEKDYTSTTALQGGQIYYLHLGYRKDSSIDTGDDQVVINSIKVYGTHETTYNFINDNGKYQSNNQGKENTVANSYIPIDLTDLTGKYNLIVNANVSSESGDYGYATVTSSITAPSYSSSTGRFIYISGTSDTSSTPTDYTTVLQGGSMYYLHLGYYKNATTDSGDDKFTVNSIQVTPNDSELYHTEVTTNSEGQAITQIPFGKYQVIEVNTPEGYESIEPITINFKNEDKSVVENNNNIQVSVNENGEFTIENKQLQRVIVHHYLKNDEGEYTQTKVAEDEVIEGKSGEEYKTTPHLDLNKYELEKDSEENYVIPENANGTYDDDSSVDQEVIYYYEAKDYPLIVHHYIEGTADPVPLKDGSLAEDEEYTGKEGESYTTEAIEDSKLDERYELVETPLNATGNYIAGETVVTYYYKTAERSLTITKTGQNGEVLSGVNFEILSKEDSDKKETIGEVGKIQANGNYYFVEQNGKYISNNQQQNSTIASSYIKIDLTGKESVTLKINAEISSQSSDYGYATITSNTSVPSYSSSNGRIFRISGQVAAKDYTTTLNGGEVYYLHLCYYKNSSTSSYNDTFTINSIEINDYNIFSKNDYVTDDQGKINVTLDAGEYLITETEVPEGYKLPDNPTQTINITKYQDSYELNIQNEKIPAQVIVHHYIEETEEKVPSKEGGVVEDEIKTGVVGDMYASKVSEKVQPNYEYVSSTNNTSGIMTEDTIEVIYYYKMQQAGIEQTIDKIGTEKITNEDEKVNYTITYTGKVTNYIGKATVTMIDTLPYEIDEARSSLDGGLYNDAQKTITWTIDVNDIDTYTKETSGNISITKQISVAYENMDYSKTSFENKVQGSIYLEETEQEEPTNEDKVETQTEFTTNVTVTKVWNHTNNNYTIPTQVEVQVKKGAEVVARQIINSSNKVGEDNNTWSYTFTGLPKYDENGDLIIYTVDEAEVNSGDLAYYDKQIEGNTITNIYNGPIISATKESETENGLDYVVEGETITYTITVKNDGGVDKVVKVQDSAPEGTTLKTGSIKVNGSGADNYTEGNLNNGIDVNVGAHSETTVSFEVTVNPLEGEELTKVIRNTAIVDGEETEEVTDTVNKSKLVFNKTSETENKLDYVVAGEKITYKINLNNEGTAPATTEVKDSAPEGTTFVPGSIVVKVDNNQINTEKTYLETELNQGIEVEVPAGKTAVVSFEVTVNDIEDGTIIRNQATVGESEEPNTNETENKYVEPIISAEKTAEVERPEIGYAQEGEKITYTITVTNNGGLSKDVEIKDTIPEGTTFVEGSIKVNNEDLGKTLEDLTTNGIEVNVPAKEGTVAGTAEVSFEVTVNTLDDGLYTKVIGNTAYVDGTPTNNVEVTVNKANIVAHKESDPANGSTVKQGDTITYKIVLDNTLGTAAGTVRVQDTVPAGTTYQDNTMKLAGEPIGNNSEDLANGFNVTVPAGQTSTLEFKVTVNDNEDGFKIRNVATVNGEETNETEHTYVEPIISAEKTVTTENSLAYVVEGEKITYTITVTNNGGLSKDVEIKDTIPEGTTFVEGSIKVNNVNLGNTLTNLTTDGITVNVPAKLEDVAGTALVSFEVTVNQLEEGVFYKEIENTALVDEKPTNLVTEIVNKADVKGEKSSIPTSGETVEKDDEITYKITVNNDGTAPSTAEVKDSIPAGTTFVEESIKVEGSDETYELSDLTTKGIEVPLNADESKTVEFKVRVNDIENGTQIRNVATVNGEETNETEHTYVEPIISGEKTIETENGLEYVVEGEVITYRITATNSGDAAGTVKVSDDIPEDTTFVDNSIKVGNKETGYTAEELSEGIDVEVEARGKTEVEFQVRVNDLEEGIYEDTIENTAIVDGNNTNEVTEEVHKPHVVPSKTSNPASGEEVTAGNEITYTISLRNDGTAPGEVTVKDEIPEGTTFVPGSIKVGGESRAELTQDDLTSGIDVDVSEGQTTTVEFKVTVNDINNEDKIRNIAYADDKLTEEVEHTYIEPIISAEKTATTEKGLDYVVEGETITYTIMISNTGDLGKDVVVRDTIPEGTSFVEGSVKVNNAETENTQDNLAEGIKVNVAKQNKAEVSFKVRVNSLAEGKYEGTIRNTAYVDDVPTEEVTEEVKKAHVRIEKTSNPESGSTVVNGQEITYTISLNNEGTAPSRLVVTDSIPEGTSYVEGSIKVNGADLGNTLEDLTTNGIEVTVPAGETVTLEFKVTVNDLDNGDTIANKASIRNPETEETKETNEVTHEYVEAVIEAEKEMTTEKGLSYVIPGEQVTYTIRVRNEGDLSKKLIVADSIPEGTEFANESVLLNGEESNITKDQLETGFEIEVAGQKEVTISFSVTVKEEATEIRNKAIVDGKETNETAVPVISYEKRAEVIRQTEEEISDGSVTAGDKIKYTIRVNNLGEEAVTNVIVKDLVPEGTTLSKINNSGVINDKKEITWTIANILGKGYAEVSFEVSVDYDVVDNKTITNIATVDEEETNEVETPYDKPEIKEESTIEKTGTEIINSTEDSVTYKVTYNASIKDYIGEGKVTITDYLPYGINVEEQYLDGGKYDAGTKTITWEEDLGTIDTYTNGEKIIAIEKEITIKYEYGEDAETLNGTLVNRVEGKLELTQENPDKPGEDVVVKEDTVEDTHETKVQIPTHIIVHHYIEGTATKVPSKVNGEVVEDERTDGYVGEGYTTSASSNVQENYKLVSNSGNTSGTMTRTPIEIIYYYKLQPGDITENTIEKSGTDKIVNKDDKVSYEVTYTGKVENYVGNVKVEIIDYLPYAIDEAVSNLNGGIYDPLTKTIRWEEDLGRVNTYTEGAKEITITKNIEVVFTQMDYTGTSFTNRAQGKIILEETKQEQDAPEASKETQTEFVKNVTVEKVWDDNNDIKGRRPESVTVQLTANEQTTYKDEELEKVVLDGGNGWTYTFSDLPKYTEQGQEIAYSVVESETNAGDLEYYEEPEVETFTDVIRVTNKYKLMQTELNNDIQKTGTEVVTSSKQEVDYKITYEAEVEEYIGEALLKLVDYLPYEIDENLSELDGGTYDKESKTITWEDRVDHINTFENGTNNIKVEKNIKLVYKDLNPEIRKMTNRVKGTLDLYEKDMTNTIETTYETKVEIPGKVIVKYVDKDSGKEITYEEQNEEGQIEEKTYGYELDGLAGDSYSTEQKDIYGYTYIENTNNTSGKMIEGTIEVIYYYERTNAGGVIVHYVDEEGNKLTEDEVISGKVADTYKTEQKEIPNYDFVRVEGQTEGELVVDTIEVTYIYKKIPAKVIVQYLEKDDTPDDNTDNVVLAEQEIIEGFSGDSYSTERKEIENFKLSGEIPSNAEGVMTREDIYVIYYYERKPSGIVTVKYVDVDTNEEILHKVEDTQEYATYREQLQGLCGLEYTTEQKDIPYYNFIEEMRPSNSTGIYTEEDIEVIYYYRKQTFNLSVEKQIERITVNGEPHSLKDGLDQIDVVASKVQETDIVVTYKIVVSNPSEIEGSTKVIESIPDFFRVTDGTSSEWTENDKSLEAQVTLQPGETKELTVVLRWIRNGDNFGLQINTVVLTNVSNPANYEETNLDDNTSTAEVIFSVKTGGIDTAIVIGTALIIMIGALMVTIYLKERKTK